MEKQTTKEDLFEEFWYFILGVLVGLITMANMWMWRA